MRTLVGNNFNRFTKKKFNSEMEFGSSFSPSPSCTYLSLDFAEKIKREKKNKKRKI